MNNLYIVRHASSESNEGTWSFEKHDGAIPLTELGRTQAHNLGKSLFHELWDSPIYMFSSPYRRAVETAKGIIEGMSNEAQRFEKNPKISGPTLIPGLAERTIKKYDLIKKELEFVAALPADEKFYYQSATIESAMSAASRMQQSIYDIKSFARTKNSNCPLNIIVVSHSFAIEAWDYLEKINATNKENCNLENFGKKVFPLEMEGFGEARRLKNAEYIKLQFD